MKQSVGLVWSFILGWGFLMILLAFFVQYRDFYGDSPILRQRLEVQEAFQAGGGAGSCGQRPQVSVQDIGEETGRLSPGDPGLSAMRMPYTLLNGWLNPKLPEEAGDDRSSYNPPGRVATIPDSTYGETVEDIYKETKVTPRPSFTSQTCYESDFQTRIERTGNYRQLTNNYKRGDPDSCSAPLQDTALGYYKTEPVSAEGCLKATEWKMS